MSTPVTGPARSSLYRQYSRGSSGGASSSSIENLPPRTLSRVSREVRDLIKSPPEGIRLVVDNDTGLPANLGEIVVSVVDSNVSMYPIQLDVFVIHFRFRLTFL